MMSAVITEPGSECVVRLSDNKDAAHLPELLLRKLLLLTTLLGCLGRSLMMSGPG